MLTYSSGGHTAFLALLFYNLDDMQNMDLSENFL